MPHFDIVKKAQPARTFRVASVMGAFDLQTNKVVEHFVGDLDLPENWRIGLIVGNSGTGKTTIAKTLFPDAYVDKFDYTHETILDDMPREVSMTEIEKAFNSVGFSSPPPG
jgi:ABC-type glutathione transport system ATPase component